jgi:polynucleotide 5'-hydroxyl-kinase GRC3/NOL9
MPTDLPDAWLPALDAVRNLPDGAIVLFIGAPDRGKTTLVTQLAKRLTGDGIRTAIVDTDIGQSEIGPPGTVGVGGARRDWAADRTSKLSDLKAGATFFVGAFAPSPVVLELVTATMQAVRYAVNAKAQRILVDTTGMVMGPAARRLKVAKAQAIAPVLIIGMDKGEEIRSLLTALQSATGALLLSLGVPPEVGRKSPAMRATRRMTRLSKALTDSHEIALSLNNISLVGCMLGSGSALTPELVRWTADTLRVPVVRGERGEGGLTLFVSGKPRSLPDAATAPIASYFKVSSVRVIALSNYSDALLGLHEETGRLLALGRLLQLDAERHELVLSTPLSLAPERVRLVLLGRVRVPPDADGYSEIRVGEV